MNSNVHIKVGNLLESDAQTLVNTVNTVGVMGKGIALAFKAQFPDMYADYVRRCASNEVQLGRPYLYRGLFPPYILNFPTKDHWRSHSRLTDIVDGLEHLERNYREWGIESLAVPPLGCGNGGLDWSVVGPTLYKYLAKLEIPVELYAPHDTAHSELTPEYLQRELGSAWTYVPDTSKGIDPSWVALVDVVSRVSRNPFSGPIGRIKFQKLAYFATIAGVPTGLEFSRGAHGPYASGSKELLATLVRHDLIKERRIGRMIAIEVGPTFVSARRAYSDSLAGWEEILESVSVLVSRFADTRAAEVAATVRFVADELESARGAPPSEFEVYAGVREWKVDRQPSLDDAEVASSIRQLGVNRWLGVVPSDELPLQDELFC